jgi:hypothetical protein
MKIKVKIKKTDPGSKWNDVRVACQFATFRAVYAFVLHDRDRYDGAAIREVCPRLSVEMIAAVVAESLI